MGQTCENVSQNQDVHKAYKAWKHVLLHHSIPVTRKNLYALYNITMMLKINNSVEYTTHYSCSRNLKKHTYEFSSLTFAPVSKQRCINTFIKTFTKMFMTALFIVFKILKNLGFMESKWVFNTLTHRVNNQYELILICIEMLS